MNIKHFFKCLLVCSLALLTLSAGASATSIFGDITDSPSQEDTLLAPSYGNVCGKEPDSVSKKTNGDTVLTYQNVSLDDFDQFGRYLDLLAYYVTEQKDNKDIHVFSVGNDTLSFSVEYRGKEEILQITYPEGTMYDDVFFPGCKRLFPGDTFSRDNVGDFLIADLKTSDKIYEAYFDGNYSKHYSFSGIMLMLNYDNTSNEKHYYYATNAPAKDNPYMRGLSRSDTFYFTALYRNGDEEHIYLVECAGKLDGSNRIVINDDVKAFRPKTKNTLAVGIEAPLEEINADRGCFAITIGRIGGYNPEYVLVLSENGHKMY